MNQLKCLPISYSKYLDRKREIELELKFYTLGIDELENNFRLKN